MNFQFEPKNDSCFVIEENCGSYMRCEIRVAPDVLIRGLKHLLMNADVREHILDGIMFDRLEKGIRVHDKTLTYTFDYVHLFPMVMEQSDV